MNTQNTHPEKAMLLIPNLKDNQKHHTHGTYSLTSKSIAVHVTRKRNKISKSLALEKAQKLNASKELKSVYKQKQSEGGLAIVFNVGSISSDIRRRTRSCLALQNRRRPL